MAKRTYTSTCHLIVNGASVWPNTKEHVRAGRRTTIVLDESQAARYGRELVEIGPAEDENKGRVEVQDKGRVEVQTKADKSSAAKRA